MPKRIYTAAYASLRLSATDLDPMDVTSRLRLPPDHSHRAGEPNLVRSRSGRVVEYARYKQGLWSMSSKQWVDSPVLETHIAWLLTQVEPRADALRALLAAGVEGDIFCYSFGSAPKPPTVSRDLLHRAEALGLRVDVDHYEGTAANEVVGPAKRSRVPQ